MITIVECFSMSAVKVAYRFKVFHLSGFTSYCVELAGITTYFLGIAATYLADPFIAFIDELAGIAWPGSYLIFVDTTFTTE